MKTVVSSCNINADSNNNREKDKLSKPTKHLAYSTNLTAGANLPTEAYHLTNITPETKTFVLIQNLMSSLSKHLHIALPRFIGMTSENDNIEKRNTNENDNNKKKANDLKERIKTLEKCGNSL